MYKQYWARVSVIKEKFVLIIYYKMDRLIQILKIQWDVFYNFYNFIKTSLRIFVLVALHFYFVFVQLH